jgi:NitT/TauT family transport system substrate-binding protein
MNRRAFLLAGVAGAVATAGGGVAIARARRSGDGVLRIGVMSNLTHAPLLAGLASGRIRRAVAPLTVETMVFRAGPRVTEALLGGAIDAGTAGPAPIVVHHARHVQDEAGTVSEAAALRARRGLRVLGGCCSGGASLVVSRTSGIRAAADLRGKRVAITQLGTTQDIALRVFLRDAGLRDRSAGGDVTVLAIAAATILDQMARGELHAAWLAEPWATRMVLETGAERLVDERDLWQNRRFATALLVARAADAGSAAMGALATALEDEVARAIADPATTLSLAHAELKRHVGNPGRYETFVRASALVDFTFDPLRASVERFGDAAAGFGLCPPHATAGLFA